MLWREMKEIAAILADLMADPHADKAEVQAVTDRLFAAFSGDADAWEHVLLMADNAAQEIRQDACERQALHRFAPFYDD